MNKRLLLILTYTVFFMRMAHAQALCDCIMHPIKRDIDTSKYIFIVKAKKILQTSSVDSIFHNPVYYNAEVKVEKVLKKSGEIMKGDTMSFITDRDECAFGFELNKEYLLFAYKDGSIWHLYSCSYSGELKDSKKYVKIIKKHLNK
jgi:hypothetical protein